MSEMRLLIVEDEFLIAQALHKGLTDKGFAPTVTHTAADALEALWQSPFDLILLDVMLPEGDEAGFTFAREVREAGFRQPILFLTAREALPDKVKGLEYGDDYLAKPFALIELVARLKALYRRGEVRPQKLTWKDIELLSESREVRCGHTLLRLTAKEYEVLELFMLNPGRIFSRDEVLERVWGADFDSSSNLIDVYIKNLRAKVSEKVIETVRGLGYRFPG